jgi:hypothetical protein
MVVCSGQQQELSYLSPRIQISSFCYFQLLVCPLLFTLRFNDVGHSRSWRNQQGAVDTPDEEGARADSRRQGSYGVPGISGVFDGAAIVDIWGDASLPREDAGTCGRDVTAESLVWRKRNGEENKKEHSHFGGDEFVRIG